MPFHASTSESCYRLSALREAVRGMTAEGMATTKKKLDGKKANKKTEAKGANDASKAIDLRAKRLLIELQKGLPFSQAEWARRASLKPTQVSAIFHDRAGVSVGRLFDLVETSGQALAIARPGADTRALLGNATSGGWVETLLASASSPLPALVNVDSDFGPFAAGDVLVIDAGGWAADDWILVRHQGDGALRIYLCTERNGMRLIQASGGEELVFNEELHAIVGVVAEWRRRPRGRMK